MLYHKISVTHFRYDIIISASSRFFKFIYFILTRANYSGIIYHKITVNHLLYDVISSASST